MELSNCCTAPIVEDTDFCSDCKEHCEAIEQNKIGLEELNKIGLTGKTGCLRCETIGEKCGTCLYFDLKTVICEANNG